MEMNVIRRVEIRGSAPGVADATAQLQRLAVAQERVGQVTRLSTQQLNNMQFQLQDIVVSLASGQSPFTVLMQQGSQMAQMFQSGTGVLAAIRAVGTGIVSFLTNPLNLAVAAFALAAAAAASFFGKTKDSAKKAEDALKEHEALIRSIKDAWGDAAKGLDAYERQSRLVIQGGTQRALSEKQASLASDISGLVAPRLAGRGGIFMRTPNGSVINPMFSPFANDLADMQRTQNVTAFQDAVQRRLAISPNAASLQEAGKRLIGMTNALADKNREIQQLQAALGIMGPAGANAFPDVGFHNASPSPLFVSPLSSVYGIEGNLGDHGFHQPLAPNTPVPIGAANPNEKAAAAAQRKAEADARKAAAEAQRLLNETIRSYNGLANSAADAARAYGDALHDSISKIDDVRSSLKSLIDTAVHGGNVFKALGEMLLDLGSTGITNALFGAQGTSAGGILGPLLSGLPGMATPTKPMNLAAAPIAGQPIGGNPWAPWLSGAGGVAAPAVSAAMGGIGSDALAGGAVGLPGFSTIALHEGTAKTGDPYNTVFGYGKFGGAGANLTGMSIDQVLALSASIKKTAGSPAGPMGTYQIIGSTLRDAQKALKLPGSTLFTEQIQDQIAQWRMGLTGGNPANIRQAWTSLVGESDSFLTSIFGQIMGTTLHSGGMVGEGGSLRSVPLSAFIGAPRMHSGGLAHDERPAILQTGERVLSRAEVRRGGGGGYNPTINVDARGSQIGETQVRGIVASALKDSRENLKSNFGDVQRSYNLLKG